MSTKPVVSMEELEMESAELLPGRETLCAPRCGGYSSFSYTSQSYNGNGILNFFNGSNVLSGDNIYL